MKSTEIEARAILPDIPWQHTCALFSAMGEEAEL